MSEYAKLAAGFGDRYLAALAESQDQFLKCAAAHFALAAKLLSLQRDYTEKFLTTVTPGGARPGRKATEIRTAPRPPRRRRRGGARATRTRA